MVAEEIDFCSAPFTKRNNAKSRGTQGSHTTRDFQVRQAYRKICKRRSYIDIQLSGKRERH